MTRLDDGRAVLLNVGLCAVKQLVALTSASDAMLRRGCVQALRNCCFETAAHARLLAETRLLDALLLQVVAPAAANVDGEERAQLPDAVRFGIERSRTGGAVELEPEADVRRAAVDALILLSATHDARATLHVRGVYIVMERYDDKEMEEKAFELVDQLLAEDEHL